MPSAIAELLSGDHAAVPISGLKPYTGHMGAASDLAEVAFSLTALARGMAPATLNFQTPEADFAEIDVVTAPRRVDARYALSMSQGLGGQSLTVVLSAA